MKQNKRFKVSARLICEGALMIAMALALNLLSAQIPFLNLPRGGSVTLFSMVPILVMSYRNGTAWGLLTAFAYSLIQLLLGLDNLGWCQTLRAQVGCVLFDYILAYTALGLAQFFAKPVKKRVLALGLSAAIVCLLRFLCSFLSGYLVWYDYATATEWMSAFRLGAKAVASLGESGLCWLYSFLYNGSYMLPETVITVLGVVLLGMATPKLLARQNER